MNPPDADIRAYQGRHVRSYADTTRTHVGMIRDLT